MTLHPNTQSPHPHSLSEAVAKPPSDRGEDSTDRLAMLVPVAVFKCKPPGDVATSATSTRASERAAREAREEDGAREAVASEVHARRLGSPGEREDPEPVGAVAFPLASFEAIVRHYRWYVAVSLLGRLHALASGFGQPCVTLTKATSNVGSKGSAFSAPKDQSCQVSRLSWGAFCA